jgi:hypothetical protein
MAKIKLSLVRGQGRPPGYQWNVWVLDLAYREATEFLNKAQYRHLALQVRELATENDPTHSNTISIDAIEEFYELRDWGGILHPRNVRLFFGVDHNARAIVILGAIDKKNNGPTRIGDRIRMRRRWRKYRDGDYG